MKYVNDARERCEAAYRLLQGDTTTIEKFDSIKKLLQGLNPRLDKALSTCAKAISEYKKLEEVEVIDLAVEHLPEDTKEQKRKKRIILFLIRSWKDLKSEVARVQKELNTDKENSHSTEQKLHSYGKIVSYAKGPFGIITFAAVVIVAVLTFTNTIKPKTAQTVTQSNTQAAISSKEKLKGIEFNGKKIPLYEVAVREGHDCDSPHYHALDHSASRAIDGTIVQDPGGCGFGRIKEVKVIDIE